jgi:hypothetical protein
LPLPIPTLLSNSLLVMNFNDCNRFRMLSLPPIDALEKHGRY